MPQANRTKVKNLAIFFYKDSLTQEQVVKIENYYAAAGYYVGFRRKMDAIGTRDVIEFDATCVGGDYPTIYDDKFGSDATKVLDENTLAEIMAGEVEPPAIPKTQAASVAAPPVTVSAPQ